MSYKVLIYSCNTIFHIGISLCVKKSIPNTTICKANTLEQAFATKSQFDLYIFDVVNITSLFQIKEQMLVLLKEKKAFFFVENNEFEKFLEFENAIYINKNSTELLVIKQLRLLCKKRKYIIKYRKATKCIVKDNTLSERELQCAKLLMKGYSVTQISKELSLKMSTISTYKRRIQNKTNTKNVVQLIKHYIH